jgi:TrmH family RNA methyltransferase
MLARCRVCLVGTANPENLGGVARLLDNFGLSSLTLVAPRVGPDDHRAQVVGRAARAQLDAARVVATVDEAVRDCAFVVGFSARRGGDRPRVGLRALGARLAARAPSGGIALLFGPEDCGLVAEDLDRCDVVVAIETPGPLASLNLTQAVALALWELARGGDAAASARDATDDALDPPASVRGGATRGELDALVDHACAALDAIGYFHDADERALRHVWLRRVLATAALGAADVRGLHGICARILRAR